VRRVKFPFIRTFIEKFKTCNRRFWKRAILSKEDPLLGNMQGDGLPGLLRDR